MKKLFTLIFTLFIFSAISAQEEGMWIPQAENRVPEDFYVYDISAVDENIVWVLLCPSESNGEPCQILKTLDGGDTWTDIDISSLGGSFAVSLFALSATTAWLTIADETAAIRYIYKTTDAGDSWTEQRAITATNPDQVFAPVVHFNNEQRGFYIDVYGNRAGRTTNGGDNWSLSGMWIPGPAIWFFSMLSSCNWWDVKGDTIWWPTSRHIHRSTTGGLFWTGVPLPDTNHTVSSVKFGNNGLGLAISDTDGFTGDFVMNETAVYKSINNGNSWTRLDNLPFPLSVITHIPGTDNGFIGVSGAWHYADLGQEYASAYTLDGGDTWTDYRPRHSPARHNVCLPYRRLGRPDRVFRLRPRQSGAFQMAGQPLHQHKRNARSRSRTPRYAQPLPPTSATRIRPERQLPSRDHHRKRPFRKNTANRPLHPAPPGPQSTPLTH
jgi:hypothetical protein